MKDYLEIASYIIAIVTFAIEFAPQAGISIPQRIRDFLEKNPTIRYLLLVLSSVAVVVVFVNAFPSFSGPVTSGLLELEGLQSENDGFTSVALLTFEDESDLEAWQPSRDLLSELPFTHLRLSNVHPYEGEYSLDARLGTHRDSLGSIGAWLYWQKRFDPDVALVEGYISWPKANRNSDWRYYVCLNIGDWEGLCSSSEARRIHRSWERFELNIASMLDSERVSDEAKERIRQGEIPSLVIAAYPDNQRPVGFQRIQVRIDAVAIYKTTASASTTDN